MALLLAVLIGVVLIAPASVLLAVQLLSRRSAASASNRDLAEAAAMNGLNRIEAELNRPGGDHRYLWNLPSSAWPDAASASGGASLRPLLSQPCSFTPIDAATLALLQGGSVGGERNDGGALIPAISSRYRLRNYTKSGADWVLAVEGFSERGAGSGRIQARSLISRRYEVSNLGVSRAGTWDDWAVLAGRELELGSTRILDGGGTGSGPGRVQLVLEDTAANREAFAATNSCDDGTLLARVGSSEVNLQGRIWPTLGQAMPGAGWFESNTVVDRNATTGDIRVWQIDDSQSTPSNFTDAVVSGSTIRLPQSRLCTGNTANLPCQIWIRKIRLRSRTLLVEAQNRPVILRLSDFAGTIDLADQGKICAVAVGSASCYSGAPQQLVILGTAADTATGCNDSTSSDQSVVSISGDSLPEALVVLPEATFRLTGPASLRGLVWAKRVCAAAGLTLRTLAGSEPVIRRANATWRFPLTATAGRTLTRARGTSIDPFQPWP
ncbi:MAG: hypothetical protein ACKOCM_07710 [Cyanobacteriota bacterium]